VNPLIVAAGPAAVANAAATAAAAAAEAVTGAPEDATALPGGPELPVSGAILFARYAYPPNELGYCGPPDSRALLEYGAEGQVDRGLLELAKGFAGAWPYLELIAGATAIESPLDRRVVEGYWLGSSLLDSIDMKTFGASLVERFRRKAGRGWGYLEEAIPVGALPNHSFHVFGVYPWVGLLKTGRAATPLEHLDRCRIRWGQVVATDGDEVTVMSRPLTYENGVLGLGDRRLETARRARDGVGFLDPFRPGEWVSLHWDWVCDRLSRRQLHMLRRSSLQQLDITNGVAHPGARAAID
jgi:hypothetical protein